MSSKWAWLARSQPGGGIIWRLQTSGSQHICGREGVGFAEAALINMLANDPDERVPQTLNINLRNGDLGGTGPRLLEHFFSTYYLYLAVKADAVP